MNINVKLFATLRRFHEKEFPLEISKGTTVGQVIKMLALPEDEVAIIMVNGVGKKPDTILSNEDVLALFPAVGGG
jgi:molybdopterin synthase sulfur carrier subunit